MPKINGGLFSIFFMKYFSRFFQHKSILNCAENKRWVFFNILLTHFSRFSQGMSMWNCAANKPPFIFGTVFGIKEGKTCVNSGDWFYLDCCLQIMHLQPVLQMPGSADIIVLKSIQRVLSNWYNGYMMKMCRYWNCMNTAHINKKKVMLTVPPVNIFIIVQVFQLQSALDIVWKPVSHAPVVTVSQLLWR